MTDFIYFVGRFHVLVLHLPIGILLLAVVMEGMSRVPRYARLAPAVSLVWLLGALSALVTVALGYMHAAEPGFSGPAVDHHRWAGSLLALFAFVVWAWRIEAPRLFAKVWPVPLAVIVGLLSATGHLGGNLTHGPTYLTEFAPGPFRSGGEGGARTVAEDQERPKVTDLAKADIYLDIVSPALRDSCASCHNDSRKRGQLSIMNHAALMKGGETGPSIVANDPEKSDLYRRITLPSGDVDYMPKNKQNPISPAKVAAIRWWISIGAPDKGLVGDLKPSNEVQADLKKALGL